MDVYTALQEDATYRTVELDSTLLLLVENGEKLFFKSSEEGFVVICSQDKTFSLKKKNHSNTILLASHSINSKDDITNDDKICKRVIGFTSFDSDFECNLSQGTIDITRLPLFDIGQDPFDFLPRQGELSCSVDELKDNSPISESEFENVFYNAQGSEVSGYACVLSDLFVTETLTRIIITAQSTATLANNGERPDDEAIYHNINILDLCQTINDERFPFFVLKSVTCKFSTQKNADSTYYLDEKLVATWYGIETLKKHARNLIGATEFLIEWKKMFPGLYNVPIEINWLRGNFARPVLGKIQYFPKKDLSTDAKSRFKELFSIQGIWDLTDIIPFIEDLNVKKKKIENFVIMYAKKKTEGKKILVMSRT